MIDVEDRRFLRKLRYR